MKTLALGFAKVTWVAIVVAFLLWLLVTHGDAQGQAGTSVVGIAGMDMNGMDAVAINCLGDVYGLGFGTGYGFDVTYLGNIYSGGPIATEKMTWGEVKTKYSNKPLRRK